MSEWQDPEFRRAHFREKAPLPNQPPLEVLVAQGLSEIEFPEDFISDKKELPEEPLDLTSYEGARKWVIQNCKHPIGYLMNITDAGVIGCRVCGVTFTYDEYKERYGR